MGPRRHATVSFDRAGVRYPRSLTRYHCGGIFYCHVSHIRRVWLLIGYHTDYGAAPRLRAIHYKNHVEKTKTMYWHWGRCLQLLHVCPHWLKLNYAFIHTVCALSLDSFLVRETWSSPDGPHKAKNAEISFWRIILFQARDLVFIPKRELELIVERAIELTVTACWCGAEEMRLMLCIARAEDLCVLQQHYGKRFSNFFDVWTWCGPP